MEKSEKSGTDCQTDAKKADEEYKNFIEEPGDDDGENRVPVVRNSTAKTVLITVKSIIDSEILNLPLIFKTYGIIGGLIVTVIMNIITQSSTYIILKCKDITQRYSLALYSKLTMGLAGILITKTTMTIIKFTCSCLQLKVFGEFLRTLFMIIFGDTHSTKIYYNENFLIIIVAIILFPMTFSKDISSITKYTYIGILGLSTFYFISIFLFIKKSLNGDINFDKFTQKNFLFGNGNLIEIFRAFGAYFNCLTYQSNIFPLYLPLKPRSTKNMMKATTIGAILCSIIYSSFGIIGLMMYDNIDDSIHKYMEKDLIFFKQNGNKTFEILIIIAEIAFLIHVAFSVIMYFFFAKANLFGFAKFIVKKYKEKKNKNKNIKMNSLKEINEDKIIVDDDDDNDDNKNESEYKYLSMKWRIILSIIFYSLVTYFAIASEKIIMISDFNGSTVSNYLNLLAPAFFYFYFSRKMKFSFEKVLAGLLVVVGLVLIGGYIIFRFI